MLDKMRNWQRQMVELTVIRIQRAIAARALVLSKSQNIESNLGRSPQLCLAEELIEEQTLPTHRHVKSGGLYVVMCEGKLEKDCSNVVIYRGQDGDVWVRPSIEFYDGRFETLC
jgi:hypothetical protein